MMSFGRKLTFVYDGVNRNRYRPVGESPPRSIGGLMREARGQPVQLLKATVVNGSLYPEEECELMLHIERYPEVTDEAPAKGVPFRLLWDDLTERKDLSANGGEADFLIVLRPKDFSMEYHQTPTTGKKIEAFLGCKSLALACGLVRGEYRVRLEARSRFGTVSYQRATIDLGKSWNDVDLELL